MPVWRHAGNHPHGMSAERLGELMLWAKSECEQRGMKARDFLEYLRWEVRKAALADAVEKPPVDGVPQSHD
jgi:hypothetical protein